MKSGTSRAGSARDRETRHRPDVGSLIRGRVWQGILAASLTLGGPLVPHVVAASTTGVLAAGEGHTCAVTPGGAVRCWGDNQYGQLGDGTTTNRLTPTAVNGLESNVVGVVAGFFHTCALTAGGAVYCWGRNSGGQLGDGTQTNRPTPVPVSALDSGVVAVAAGSSHTCALTGGGAVQCWGFNSFGDVGDGTETIRLTPVPVSGLDSGVAAITAGNLHTCAVTTGGAAKCWGQNGDGELGDGTTTSRSTPVDVSGLSGGVAAVAAGFWHTCAMTTGGAVKCWGDNIAGALGDGTQTTRLTPVQVSGLASGAEAVVAGGARTCALMTGGAVWCWGLNQYGQLGDGTTTDRWSPVSVTGLGGSAVALAASSAHTCVVTTSGAGQCWGANFVGNLGDGTTTIRLTPVYVIGFGYRPRGDYDGDRRSDAAVYRPSTGSWFSLDSSTANTTYAMHGWGDQAQGDVPLPGDYDGDGVVDPCVFQPATGTWFIMKSSAGYADWTWFGWGMATDTPVPGDYDGDEQTDLAVYRPATGEWCVKPSSGAATWSVVFGATGDVALQRIR
jgi:alpha-tubulin suppressor-like RCC1 family protein